MAAFAGGLRRACVGHLVEQPLRAGARGHHLCNRYLNELLYAEALGFDGVVVNEHHANAYGNMPVPILIASILARQTQRCKIAVVGNALPLYNPPVSTTEEFAMSDVCRRGTQPTARALRWRHRSMG